MPPARPPPPVVDTRRYQRMIGLFGLLLVVVISISFLTTHDPGHRRDPGRPEAPLLRRAAGRSRTSTATPTSTRRARVQARPAGAQHLPDGQARTARAGVLRHQLERLRAPGHRAADALAAVQPEPGAVRGGRRPHRAPDARKAVRAHTTGRSRSPTTPTAPSATSTASRSARSSSSPTAAACRKQADRRALGVGRDARPAGPGARAGARGVNDSSSSRRPGSSSRRCTPSSPDCGCAGCSGRGAAACQPPRRSSSGCRRSRTATTARASWRCAPSRSRTPTGRSSARSGWIPMPPGFRARRRPLARLMHGGFRSDRARLATRC